MKKVLVTGADGFIGSHLTELLLENGYQVRALSYYNSFNFWGWLEDIPAHPKLEVVCGDIRDPHYVKHIMKDMDIVFHLAALISIPYSIIATDSYIDTNVKGTLNVCQAAKELGGIRVIITSTSEAYGTAQYLPIDEKHPKLAKSPYSASKIGADALALSFHNAFDLPVTIARLFNTFGPRQSARMIIPTIISQIANGMKEIKLGDLTPTRDFTFVKDICKGFILLAEHDLTIGREINIASNNEISMNGILEQVKKIMKSDAKFIFDEQRKRPGKTEIFRSCGDNTLLKQLTGFTPEYDIEKGLQETCNWFANSENLKKYKPGVYNL
ncbi:MAG: SDR family NAD(P)-dependent oxidoreductase [Lentimicrobiaceae bacterium]|jgi:NAD dependent epimerase/dehydratase